jgi:hypothetical protein
MQGTGSTLGLRNARHGKTAKQVISRYMGRTEVIRSLSTDNPELMVDLSPCITPLVGGIFRRAMLRPNVRFAFILELSLSTYAVPD